MEPTSHLAEKYPRHPSLGKLRRLGTRFPSVRAHAVEQSGTQNLSMSFHGFYKTEQQQQQTNKQTKWNEITAWL